MTHPSHPRGFTLIEMLLVVAIIGILVTMLAPRMQMMGGPRVTAAARVLTQLTRYARTMALLNQRETVIRVSADGVIRVEAVGASTRPTFPVPSALAGAERGGYDVGGGDLDGEEDASAAGAIPDLNASIAVERRLEHVTVTFEGFTDTMTELMSQTGENRVDDVESDVRFRSNGTCRPHRYTLIDTTGVKAVVTVDILGLARIETGEGVR